MNQSRSRSKKGLFSKRIQAMGINEGENELSLLWRSAMQSSQSPIDLTESNPTKLGYSFPWAGILHEPNEEDFSSYDPQPLGLVSARDAIADHFGFPYQSENLALTTGSSESISYLLKLLTNPGDDVLVPSPGYPLFPILVELENCNPVDYPLSYDSTKDTWSYSLETMQICVTERTKAVILVCPSNPTGAFLSEKDWVKWEAWSSETQIPLIVDLVFSSFLFSGVSGERSSVPLPRGNEAPIFLLNGISKYLGLPQSKLAWIQILGQKDFREKARSGLEIIGDSYLSVATFVQKKTKDLLLWHPWKWDFWRKRVSRNLGVALEIDWGIYNLQFSYGGAGYYASFYLKEATASTFAEDLVREFAVRVHPGDLFLFPENQERIVFSLLVEEATFREALSRIILLCERQKEAPREESEFP